MVLFRMVFLLMAMLLAAGAVAATNGCKTPPPDDGPVNPSPPPAPVVDFSVECVSVNGEPNLRRLCTFMPLLIQNGGFREYYWSVGETTLDPFGPPHFQVITPYQHVYTHTGTFTVTLTVDFYNGQQSTKTKTVTINPGAPDVAQFTYTTRGRCVEFNTTVGTFSTHEYFWDFGDGSNSTMIPNQVAYHLNPTTVRRTYGAGGMVNVKLRITRLSDNTSTELVRAIAVENAPPEVDLQHSASSSDPTLFQFDLNATDEVGPSFDACASARGAGNVSVQWDFGDESFGSGIETSHRYTRGGTYTVTGIATDGDGASTTRTATVTVANMAPSASLTIDCTQLSCVFDGATSSDDRGVSSYAWQFPDGTQLTGQRVSRLFPAAGAYNVTLTVSDGALSSSTTRTARPTTEVAVPSYFYAMYNCRLYDSRTAAAGTLKGSESRTIPVTAGPCGIPADANVASITVTILDPTGEGFLSLQPATASAQSSLNFSVAKGSRSNNLLARVVNGSLTLRHMTPGQSHVVVDVTGYFTPTQTPRWNGSKGPLLYTPMQDCGIVDSRAYQPARLSGQTRMPVNVRGTYCVPSDAEAIAAHMVVWSMATSSAQPRSGGISMAPSGSFATTWSLYANGAQLPYANGSLTALEGGMSDGGTGGSDLVLRQYGPDDTRVDYSLVVNGSFRRPGPHEGLRYYPITACRVFEGPVHAGKDTFAQVQGNCGIPRGAKAVFANVIAKNPQVSGYLYVADSLSHSINMAAGFTVGDFAIATGMVAAVSEDPLDLVLTTPQGQVTAAIDVLGYFAQ